MTCCIAAGFRYGDDVPGFVLCGDTRLDYGDVGSTNLAVKFDILGHGWTVQMAGQWGNIGYWKDSLKQKIQSADPATIEQVCDCLADSAEHFKSSVLCTSGESYQLLLTGFPGGQPIIITANLNASASGAGHNLMVTLGESFSCIGSGSWVANALLSSRECHPSMFLEYVSYLAYEAKRASEKTGGVGRFTMLLAHRPGAEETLDRAMVSIFSESAIAQLEAYYHGIWKVPFATLPDFPPEFFSSPIIPRYQRPTRADQSIQPPLPESLGGSDES